MRDDVTINGLESVKKLEDAKVFERCNQISALVLVPLCASLFNNCLITVPVTKTFTHVGLYEIYKKIYLLYPLLVVVIRDCDKYSTIIG